MNMFTTSPEFDSVLLNEKKGLCLMKLSQEVHRLHHEMIIKSYLKHIR